MEKESELPRLKVRIGESRLSALVDSGSAATLMSASAWERLQNPPSLGAGSGLQLRSVTGGLLTNLGQVEVDIEVGHSIFTQTAHVIKGLPFDLLLGIDFIRSSRMVLNAAEGYVQVGGSCLPISSSCRLYNGPRVVSLPKPVVIPAGHFCVIPVKVDTLAASEGEVLVEFSPVLPEDTPFPQLEVSELTAKANQSGDILVTVSNPSDGSVTLPAGYVLGESTLFEGVVAAVQMPGSEAVGSAEQRSSDRWAGRWPSREAFLDQFPLEHLSGELRAKVEALLCRYEAIFASHEYDLGKIQIAAHTIRLKPGAKPIHSRPYPCSEHQREELRRQLEEMLKHGIIEPAYDGFTSPCILVRKPNPSSETDAWRLCQSFVRLNAITETVSYPLPNMQRLLEDLGRHRGYVSSMDMTKSFYQIRILPECAKYAGFSTPFGNFRGTCLLMGLKNASGSLQRVVDEVYAPLLATGKVHCYLDDLICSTTTAEEHLEMLEAVFQRAKQHDVRYKPSKTKLLCRSVKLLGHHISPEGIRVDDSKTRSISQLAEPTNKTEVRSFIGLVNFYKRYIRRFAELARPLLDLLRKNAPFIFSQDCRNSFEGLKRCLCDSPVLRYPDFSGKYAFHVYTDASSRALGAALHQEFEDGSHPVAYASRVLTPSELPQPILVKESLAVVFAVCEKFFYYLDGRHFILTTDNSALRYLLQATKEPKGSSRLVRDAMRLLDFDFEVRHRPSPEIPHVDGLSRLTWKQLKEDAEIADIDLDARVRPVCAVVEVGQQTLTGAELRAEQLRDEQLSPIINYLEEEASPRGPNRYQQYLINENRVLLKRLRSGRPVIVVPDSLQKQLVQDFHEGVFGGHAGAEKMYEKLKTKFIWRGMRDDVKRHTMECSACEGRNAGFLGRAPIQDNYQAMYPFQKISIDFLTGLPVTDRGNSVLLTAVDCFSRWVELIPLPSRSAKEVALALRDRIFFRHGMCDVVSDNGAELVSQIVTELYSLLGVRASTCTTYHPQAQGTVERTHRVIADMLAKYVSSGEQHWDMYAASCQFAMNNSVHSATKHTPYYLVHGRAARLPTEAVMGGGEEVQWSSYHKYVEQLLRSTQKAFEEVRVNVQKAQKANQVRTRDKARLRTLDIGDEVRLYVPGTKPGEGGKLASRWKSGYKIIDKFGKVNYYIEQTATQKRQLVHIDRLKLRRSTCSTEAIRRDGVVPVSRQSKPAHSQEEWHDALPPPALREGAGHGNGAGGTSPPTVPADRAVRDGALSGAPLLDARAAGESGGASHGPGEGERAAVRSDGTQYSGPRVGKRAEGGDVDGVHRPERSDSSTPEPASGSDSGPSDSGSSTAPSDSESGSLSENEVGSEVRYERVKAPGRYPSRHRRAPDRFSP